MKFRFQQNCVSLSKNYESIEKASSVFLSFFFLSLQHLGANCYFCDHSMLTCIEQPEGR